MIGYVKGVLTHKDTDYVILENNGIGIRIFVNSGFLAEMPPVGNEMQIYTYTSVREDAFILFGFRNDDELSLFRSLITVNGIGPKGGLSLLSSLSEKALRFAIYTGDVKTISGAPGIGKKTAERLVLELKDKVSLSALPADGGNLDIEESLIQNSNSKDATEALAALGYSLSEATKAVRQANPKEEDSVETILKNALKYLL